MASIVITTAIAGGHFHVAVQHPSGKIYTPRFRDVSPDARGLAQYQADCQAAAVAVIDATIPRGPNATAALTTMR